jgi:hypothetical protein
LTTPRSAKPPSPCLSDPMAIEIEMSQRCALRQHSCKTLCPCLADLIVSEIEVSQHCALPQHSCKTIRSAILGPSFLQECWGSAQC